MQSDERWMREALSWADRAEAIGEVPIGAVVVIEDRVVGAGCNRPIAVHDATAHAEINALREACQHVGNYRLAGAVLYCTLEPCIMCLGAMIQARVDRLVFGASDPKVGALGWIESMRQDGAIFNHRLECRGGVFAEESSTKLQRFFRERRQSSNE